MIHPHLGSRLVSARLTFGVHCCTLPREERCGRRTKPSEINLHIDHSPALGACHSTLHSQIDPSELAAKGLLRARRLCCLRRETAFSLESAAGSSETGSYGSLFCNSSRRGAESRWGLELPYYIVGLQEMGRLSPPESVTGF